MVEVASRRIVVIGSTGFVGNAVLNASRLDGPCKSLESLECNLKIALCVIRALEQCAVAYLLNVSSDAVYLDSREPLTEASPSGPSNWHGAMHVAREALLNATGVPTLHLRPTLIYGAGDPHNGYGPNQFMSRARRGEDIELFGDGEERRDHVHIADVARAALAALRQDVTGSLNVASGETRSFREIAERVVEVSATKIRVTSKPRSGPMPHGGFRPISIARLQTVLPNYAPMLVLEGVEREVSHRG
ncbi:MAG: NAD-dependent epimerase/dehydratase family protein [Actinobacteria bacterium]|nr:NAD-dependent epimerase/dehydratase family protein [Actinomycetota bacterium]